MAQNPEEWKALIILERETDIGVVGVEFIVNNEGGLRGGFIEIRKVMMGKSRITQDDLYPHFVDDLMQEAWNEYLGANCD